MEPPGGRTDVTASTPADSAAVRTVPTALRFEFVPEYQPLRLGRRVVLPGVDDVQSVDGRPRQVGQSDALPDRPVRARAPVGRDQNAPVHTGEQATRRFVPAYC